MLSREKIHQLFKLLNDRLAAESVVGEVYLVGGAVMCLAFTARLSTSDVDDVFVPKKTIRRLARAVGREADVDEGWLTDAVKGFLSERGEFSPWLELSHLKVYTPFPEYLLAMKCLAFRLGLEFHDEDDVRYLLRHLNLDRAEDALAIVERYYPAERIPPKTRFALKELLPNR